MKKIYSYLIFTLCVCILTSCKDDEVNDYYKQPVNLKVDITMQDNDLAASGSAKQILKPRGPYESVGLGGLLLYRSSIPVDGYNNVMALYAFDLACPVEKVAIQKIKFIGDGKAKCDKCGTIYDLTVNRGDAISPSSAPRLVVYQTYYVPGDHIVFQVTK